MHRDGEKEADRLRVTLELKTDQEKVSLEDRKLRQ